MNRPRAREGLPQPQRRRAMLVVLAGLSMSVLDGAIANIALPTIAQELRTDPATVVWVVNAYQLAVTISLLPFASLGELRGYRRVFVSGLAVFTLGSLACAQSGSLTALVASRILQGFGGVGIMSVSTALLRFIYPVDQLGRGIGINAFAGSTSAAIGPSVAAGILSIASWQSLFAINIPLGVVALVLARRALPRSPLARHRFDWLSALLSALTLARDHRRRQSSPVVCQRRVRIGGCRGRGRALCLAAAHAGLPDAGARTLCATGLRALRGELDLLVHRAESDVRLAAVLPRGGARPIGGRDRPLDDPLAGGGRFCRADRGMARRPALSGILGGIGLVALSRGLVLVASQEAHAEVSRIAWCMAICGVGFGFFQSPNNRTILASAPPERAGSASGILASARLVGQTPGGGVGRSDLCPDECRPGWHRPRRHLGLVGRRRLCRGGWCGDEQPAAFRVSSGRPDGRRILPEIVFGKSQNSIRRTRL